MHCEIGIFLPARRAKLGEMLIKGELASMRTRVRFGAATFLVGLSLAVSAIAGQSEWFSQCGQCLSPSISSKSGIGTAHALAEAKVTHR